MAEGGGRGTVAGIAAQVVTESCAPAVVVLVLPLAVAWHATGHRLGPTALWALVVAVFSSILPTVFIVRGARLGRWDGHHVRNREARMVPLSLAVASTVVGLLVLVFGGGPRDLVALDLAMLATLFVCTGITHWWKISIHAAVAGGAAATMVLIYGPWWAFLVPAVALVAWARVRLTDHTIAQAVAGAVTGPVVGGVVFVLVR
ncbi:MAG TPA: hypothetical protein VHV49_16995 [Pseudonocardiaceae bacterium]|jgi:hypothetical protein|nr:hypothetical protein [Pseudonocardiaceae bacterium]